MNRKKAYLLINGALCLVIPVLLALAALSIYREGMAAKEAGDVLAWIYTPDKISARFAPIAPIFFGGIGLALAGLILGVEEYRIGKLSREIHMQKAVLESKIRQSSPEMEREKSLQRRYTVLGWLCFAACMIPILIYILQPEHFPEDKLEWMISSLAKTFIPWTMLGLACLFVFALLRDKSIDRELAAAKIRLKEEKESKQKNPQGSQENMEKAQALVSSPAAGTGRGVTVVRIAVAVIAVVMIIMGAQNGGMRDVFVKAINLCTECVGLG